MTAGWAGPVWGEPSTAMRVPVALRAGAAAANAAYRADGGLSVEFGVVAASIAGVAHRLSGRRCEDSYAWADPGRGRLVLVVGDGVSAAGRGGEGADMAVSAACRYLVGISGGGAWGEMECAAALMAASAELERAGGDSAGELSTTLVVAALQAREGRADVALGRVGDSTAFTLAAGVWQELFGVGGGECGDVDAQADGADAREGGGQNDGELRSTATDVLPLRARGGSVLAGVETTSFALVEGTALVLLTDGVANPLRDGPSTVAPALGELLAGGQAGQLTPLALANAADFSRRGAHDDRTIVVAWPRFART
jgi:serine/threonine protein phosphatase PrpC